MSVSKPDTKAHAKWIREDALRVLQHNSVSVARWQQFDLPGVFTRPHSDQYPHLWLWDSAFAALGWAAAGIPERARDEIETTLAGQHDSGFLPHITYNPSPNSLYFPGPDKWNARSSVGVETSRITQPPLTPFCAWQVFESEHNIAWLQRVFDPYYRYLRWLYTERWDQQNNLLYIVHPWESGLDNSPIFDDAIQAIVLAWMPQFERADLAFIPQEQRPTDRDYERYIYLTEWLSKYRTVHQADLPFCVTDPLFNAIFVLSCTAWSKAAARLGLKQQAAELAKWSALTKAGIEASLSFEGDRVNLGIDLRSQEPLHCETIHAIAPILAGCDCNEPDKLLRFIQSDLLSTRYPIATTSPNSQHFQARCYWRGPVWINTQWFTWLAFSDSDTDLAAMIEQVSRELLDVNSNVDDAYAEYYSPDRGEALGSKRFTWTASLALHWLFREAP